MIQLETPTKTKARLRGPLKFWCGNRNRNATGKAFSYNAYSNEKFDVTPKVTPGMLLLALCMGYGFISTQVFEIATSKLTSICFRLTRSNRYAVHSLPAPAVLPETCRTRSALRAFLPRPSVGAGMQ